MGGSRLRARLMHDSQRCADRTTSKFFEKRVKRAFKVRKRGKVGKMSEISRNQSCDASPSGFPSTTRKASVTLVEEWVGPLLGRPLLQKQRCKKSRCKELAKELKTRVKEFESTHSQRGVMINAAINVCDTFRDTRYAWRIRAACDIKIYSFVFLWYFL
jgi:hypothetical protein